MDSMYAGWHLTYDGITSPEGQERLSDPEFLERLFLEIVEKLEMKVLRAPEFEELPSDPEKVDTDEDEGGVTGTCIITTSHLSIHTWPLRQRFSFDLYSCSKFDYGIVEELLKDRLCVKRRASHWITRNWP
jgi:spermidine synthase